jgi:4-hydroxyphenylpyruvate dioxygenase-like putative hemolysin
MIDQLSENLNLKVDHFALALRSVEEIRSWFRLLVGTGARVIEEPALRGGPDESRWIAAVDLGGMLFALVGPGCQGDSLDEFLRRMPGEVHAFIHHIAFKTEDINCTLKILEDCSGFKRLGGPIYDPRMDQVFLKNPESRIFELVRRSPGFKGTFLDGNVAGLAQSERL